MKKITDNQILGERGEALVKAAFLEIGFLYEPRGRLEAGVDGLVELRDPSTGQVRGLILAVQVKTMLEGRYSYETDDGFEYLLDANDLDYWRQSNIPVVIVLCRLSDKTLYWKPVEHGLAGEPRRLRISKSDDVLEPPPPTVSAGSSSIGRPPGSGYRRSEPGSAR